MSIVINYMPFLKKEAGKLAVHYDYIKAHDYEDLLSQGVLGWLEAESRYNTDKSNALFAYASKYAVGYMQRYVRTTNKWGHRHMLCLEELLNPEIGEELIKDLSWQKSNRTLYPNDGLDDKRPTPEQEAIRQEELHYIDVMCTIECPRNVDIIHKLCSGVKKKDLDCTLDISSNLVKRLRKYKIL